MYSDSPDRVLFESKNHVEWYDSPSSDVTPSGNNRICSQRIPLRTQAEAVNMRKETLKGEQSKNNPEFNLSDDESDSLFARSLMRPVSFDSNSGDLLWNKEKKVEAPINFSMLEDEKEAQIESVRKSASFSSKPSTSSNSFVHSSSASLITPTASNRKRPAVFEISPNAVPLATSTPIGNGARNVNKPKNANLNTPLKKPKFDDSFNDDTFDDMIFQSYKEKHPEVAKKAEEATQLKLSELPEAPGQSKLTQLPDILTTPKVNPNRSRIKPNRTPLWQKSKSMADEPLPPLPTSADDPPITVPKKSSTPMRKAKSFVPAHDPDDDFFNDISFDTATPL